MTRVRVRGIYTTALTHRFREAGHDVVQASPPIRERFDAELAHDPCDASVETTADRQGVGVVGTPDGVATVADALRDVGRDTLAWADPAPRGAVFDGVVSETLGSGAVVDLGEAEGFLPFGAVDGYVNDGDRLRVQVHETAAPWERDRPVLDTTVTVPGELVSLSRGRDGVTADAPSERATELVRTTELLPPDPPDGWGVRWEYGAVDAGMDALGDALAAASEAAADLDDAIAAAGEVAAGDAPRQVVAPEATTWVWFGRESRFALDEDRRAVTATMAGHHRTKAAHESASAAVDLVEAICGDDADGEFPFAAVTRQFGPLEGDTVAIQHGKPDGRCYSLGTAEVTEWDPEGQVTVRREMSGGGTYDALGVERHAGDVAVTTLKEGRWWYPTVYRGEDGQRRGTYVNVCTPVELFPDAARYVDLHVDVVKHRDGTVERVDDDELDDAVAAGHLSEPLAAKARSVAGAVERALGD